MHPFAKMMNFPRLYSLTRDAVVKLYRYIQEQTIASKALDPFAPDHMRILEDGGEVVYQCWVVEEILS